MPTILFSTEDIAGSNIAMNLVYNHGFQEKTPLTYGGESYKQWFGPGDTRLVELREHLYEAEYVHELLPPGTLKIFASRHKAESGIPALTVHPTGNWGSRAEVGGQPRTLGLTSARAMKTAFDFLAKNKPAGYEVTLEATHHGPTSLSTPSVWIELGSTEQQWHDNKVGEIVAQAVLHCAQEWEKQKGKACLGFGGTHYASKFNKLESEGYLFSHIAPKYALDEVDLEMIQQAVAKTSERVELAFVDWKGCAGEQRARVVRALEEASLSWEKA